MHHYNTRRNNYIKMAFTSRRARPCFLVDRVNFHEIKQRNSEVAHLHHSHADNRMTQSVWQLQMICYQKTYGHGSSIACCMAEQI